jgi:hypothetical protein
MSLIISKQLPQTLSNDFAIVTVTNFYADLRIVAKETHKDMDSKKIARGGEYHNILRNKKFFIHQFFLLRMPFILRIRNSLFFYKTPDLPLLRSRPLQHQFETTRCEVDCITTASTRQKATVVDPDVRQLTLPEQLKLTFYEEGGTEFRCERTFLHICRVLSEVIEDSKII